MKRFHGCAAVGVLAFLVGCGGSDQTDDSRVGASDEQLIRQYLEQARGFTFEQIVFDGDRVFMDRDVMAEKADLLDEIARVHFVESPGQHGQAYYYTPVPHLAAHQSGPLTAISGHYSFSAAVSEAWRGAFRQAFTQWSNASSTDCVSFTEGTGGPAQILIGVGNAGTADNGAPGAALATFPFVGAGIYRPGQSITISSTYVGTPGNTLLVAIALHEIGHTLGFNHPWKAEGTPVPGTSLNSNGCCGNASYTTVMDYSNQTTLSSDDLKALSLVFAKVLVRGRASCG